jgi:pentatricopeptide repeat protein
MATMHVGESIGNGEWSSDRPSPQRSAVWDVYASSDRPLTAREVFELMIAQGHKVNLHTVYRTIQRLHFYGRLVRVAEHASREFAYSPRSRSSVNFAVRVRCRHCLRQWNVEDDAIARELGRLAMELTAGPAEVRTEIVVSCARCLPSA